MQSYGHSIAADMNVTLDVYTGVYGSQKQISLKGKELILYLDMRIENKYKAQVPLMLWKLLIDPLTKSALALLVSNKLKMTNEDKDRFANICKSVCNKLGDEFKSDRIACCTFEDFSKHIKFLPKLPHYPELLMNTVPLAKRSVRIMGIVTNKGTNTGASKAAATSTSTATAAAAAAGTSTITGEGSSTDKGTGANTGISTSTIAHASTSRSTIAHANTGTGTNTITGADSSTDKGTGAIIDKSMDTNTGASPDIATSTAASTGTVTDAKDSTGAKATVTSHSSATVVNKETGAAKSDLTTTETATKVDKDTPKVQSHARSTQQLVRRTSFGATATSSSHAKGVASSPTGSHGHQSSTRTVAVRPPTLNPAALGNNLVKSSKISFFSWLNPMRLFKKNT